MIDVAITIGQYVGMNDTRWKACIFTLALSLAPILAGAAEVYTGSAPVATQSDRDRANALRAALGQVITQAAKGDATVLRRPEVARALARAERYARSYSYQAGAASVDAKKPGMKFQLVAQFDAAQIDALLRDQAAAPAAANAPVASNPASAPAVVATPAPAPDVPPEAEPAAAAPGSYRLWFNGLRSATDYARLIGALNANPDVRAANVEQAQGNVLQVRVDARGSLPSLAEALAAAHIAQLTNAQPPVAGVDAILDFEP